MDMLPRTGGVHRSAVDRSLTQLDSFQTAHPQAEAGFAVSPSLRMLASVLGLVHSFARKSRHLPVDAQVSIHVNYGSIR